MRSNFAILEDSQNLRMYCIDTGAIARVRKNMCLTGLTQPKWVKPGLLACMTHINHEMYMHLCFLAPKVYLCSTSLNQQKLLCTEKNKRELNHLKPPHTKQAWKLNLSRPCQLEANHQAPFVAFLNRICSSSVCGR